MRKRFTRAEFEQIMAQERLIRQTERSSSLALTQEERNLWRYAEARYRRLTRLWDERDVRVFDEDVIV